MVCSDKACKYCTAAPCGTCSNCTHPEFKNKCIQRYEFFIDSVSGSVTKISDPVLDPVPDTQYCFYILLQINFLSDCL